MHVVFLRDACRKAKRGSRTVNQEREGRTVLKSWLLLWAPGARSPGGRGLRGTAQNMPRAPELSPLKETATTAFIHC